MCADAEAVPGGQMGQSDAAVSIEASGVVPWGQGVGAVELTGQKKPGGQG